MSEISHINTNLKFIIKTTRKCNLNCSYCKETEKNSSKSFDIKLATVFFSSLNKLKNCTRLEFIWHGGEPLLMGIDFFNKILFIQQHLFNKTLSVNNVIQTNGLLLDENWINFLIHNHFFIGISYDGPAAIHNRHRKNKVQQGSYNTVMEAIKRLQNKNIQFGLLTVVTNDIIKYGASNLFNHYNLCKIENFSLLSLRNYFDNELLLKKYYKDYSSFMSEMFALWLKKDSRKLRVREFESKLNLFFGLPHSLCKDGGNCVGKYFGIEAEGDICHCDKFRDRDNFILGNIYLQTFEDILSSKKYKELIKYEQHIRSNCKKCEWFHLCKGGCLYELLEMIENGIQPGTEECFQFSIYNTISRKLAKTKVLNEFIENPNVYFI